MRPWIYLSSALEAYRELEPDGQKQLLAEAGGVGQKGLVGKEAVRLISVQRMGDMACQVFYRGQDGSTGDTIVFRSTEADLGLVSGGRKWSFEGDGELFRLVSEAERIRLAYLFDPYVAVSSSTIDPLPHQISAVYEHMLPRQPMRFLLADDPGAGKTSSRCPVSTT